MADADEAGGIGADEIEEGVLGGLGKAGADAGLGEGTLVEDPDGDQGVMGGGGGGARAGCEEAPGEAGAAGAGLIKKVVVLKRPRPRHLLHRRLNRLLDHRPGLRQRLRQRLHVQRHFPTLTVPLPPFFLGADLMMGEK